MSYSIDVNLLVYASDDSSPHHRKALAFLEGRAADPDILCLAWMTLMSYLRLATHPSVFRLPLPLEDAARNVETLLSLPRTRVISEEDGFWEAYQQVAAGRPVRGNAVPDAHLAAILRQHGVRTLYTADSDFRRFEWLEVVNPLTG
ncbi:MAG: PIN domain-containing protein [Planctomycetes bacterium]|nr:PIN domain-containing protein [Planctomycetota bacterium]